MKVEDRNTKRQRLLDAIEFKPVDRLPLACFGAPDTAIEVATGRTDFYDAPKQVFVEAANIWQADAVVQFVMPERVDRICGPSAQLQLRDGLGSSAGGLMEAWIKEKGPFSSPEEVRDFCTTRIPSAAEARQFVSPERTAQRWLELNKWGEFLEPAVWIPGHLCGSVGWMWYTTMGYENYLMAHLLYPEAISRLFAFLGEEGRLQNEGILQAIREHNLLPVVYSGEDICGNDGPMCSPSVLRELYFPHLKRAVAPLTENGIHWLWHSDGNIIPIADDIIACGIDGFQGFEEDKGMDLNALASKTCRNGKPPFLFGSINVTRTFYESPEAVRSSVARMCRMAETRGGGVVLFPSSTIMDDSPVDNVLAFFSADRKLSG